MRRVPYLIFFAALTSLGCTKSSSQKATTPEGLTVYTTFDEAVAQKIAAAFKNETQTSLNFVRLSTGEAEARLEAEKNNPQSSVWLGGVALGHSEAKAKGLTTPYDSQAAASVPASDKDAQHYWTGIYRGILVFTANREQLKKHNLTAPTSWKELADPKYKGLIEIPNPGTSGTSYTMMSALIQKDGEAKAFSFLKDLHKNIAQYTRSGQAPAKNAALGETTIGIGFAHDILTLIHDSKADLEVIYPKDGTGYEVAAVSLIKNGPQPELGKKLIDWLYTKTPSQIFADSYMVPLISNGATLKPDAQPPVDLKLIDSNVEWAGQNKTRLIEVWNEKING